MFPPIERNNLQLFRKKAPLSLNKISDGGVYIFLDPHLQQSITFSVHQADTSGSAFYQMFFGF